VKTETFKFCQFTTASIVGNFKQSCSKMGYAEKLH